MEPDPTGHFQMENEKLMETSNEIASFTDRRKTIHVLLMGLL